MKDFTGPNSSQPFSYIDSKGVAIQTVINSAKFNSMQSWIQMVTES